MLFRFGYFLRQKLLMRLVLLSAVLLGATNSVLANDLALPTPTYQITGSSILSTTVNLLTSANESLSQQNTENCDDYGSFNRRHLLKLIWALAATLVLFFVVVVVWYLKHQKQMQFLREELATSDELTGAPNRKAILEFGHAQLSGAVRYQRKLVVALLDIDNLKKINAELGNDMGDEALKLFANVIMKNLRSNEKVGRYSGEKFLVIMPESGAGDASIFFQRLRIELHETSQRKLPDLGSLTFCMGIMNIQEGISSLDDAIGLANKRLKIAKQQGPNQCVSEN